MTHTLAQHVHHTALGDLTLQTVQELGALDTLGRKLQRGHRIGLRRLQKGKQLHYIQRHVAVVITRPAQHIAARRIYHCRFADYLAVHRRMLADPGQMADNQPLQLLFTGIGGFHSLFPLSSPGNSPRTARSRASSTARCNCVCNTCMSGMCARYSATRMLDASISSSFTCSASL